MIDEQIMMMIMIIITRENMYKTRFFFTIKLKNRK